MQATTSISVHSAPDLHPPLITLLTMECCNLHRTLGRSSRQQLTMGSHSDSSSANEVQQAVIRSSLLTRTCLASPIGEPCLYNHCDGIRYLSRHENTSLGLPKVQCSSRSHLPIQQPTSHQLQVQFTSEELDNIDWLLIATCMFSTVDLNILS